MIFVALPIRSYGPTDLQLLDTPVVDKDALCVELVHGSHRLAHISEGSLCHQQQKILPHMKSRT